ncbi:hypothetical protein MAR_036890 [Mya arenaria]|uniref:Uncharacterized protein n=1 Tax=Mya arenaria TaxID=6604 RepID=A0ABY7FQN5_MYAAR|nr:hypothetical protein MAR_036890 [Mya arenaria]
MGLLTVLLIGVAIRVLRTRTQSSKLDKRLANLHRKERPMAEKKVHKPEGTAEEPLPDYSETDSTYHDFNEERTTGVFNSPPRGRVTLFNMKACQSDKYFRQTFARETMRQKVKGPTASHT